MEESNTSRISQQRLFLPFGDSANNIKVRTYDGIYQFGNLLGWILQIVINSDNVLARSEGESAHKRVVLSKVLSECDNLHLIIQLTKRLHDLPTVVSATIFYKYQLIVAIELFKGFVNAIM
jgi:hypothetical protein